MEGEKTKAYEETMEVEKTKAYRDDCLPEGMPRLFIKGDPPPAIPAPFGVLDDKWEEIAHNLQSVRIEIQELFGAVFASNPNLHREVEVQKWGAGDGWKVKTIGRMSVTIQELQYFRWMVRAISEAMFGEVVDEREGNADEKRGTERG